MAQRRTSWVDEHGFDLKSDPGCFRGALDGGDRPAQRLTLPLKLLKDPGTKVMDSARLGTDQRQPPENELHNQKAKTKNKSGAIAVILADRSNRFLVRERGHRAPTHMKIMTTTEKSDYELTCLRAPSQAGYQALPRKTHRAISQVFTNYYTDKQSKVYQITTKIHSLASLIRRSLRAISEL